MCNCGLIFGHRVPLAVRALTKRINWESQKCFGAGSRSDKGYPCDSSDIRRCAAAMEHLFVQLFLMKQKISGHDDAARTRA
jgi:hypothetical protein